MHKIVRNFLAAMLALPLLSGNAAPATSNWFPFSPSGPVSAGSAVDASVLLADYPGQDISHVIDARGHLYAGNDGHFYFPGTGKRAKFFGTNFMVNTIFPPNPDAPQQAGEYSGIVPPDAADQLATRLARMGVNIVRLHFIDGGYARPVSIWDPAYPNDTKHLDPLQVRRLDYLIFALKQHGIYCDINLHAGRQFRSQDGVKDYDVFPDTSFNKPATQFDPVMIKLQQDYAAQLLTHVNPYTKLRLADDPAVAFVEISNEDSMLYSFANDELAAFADLSSCFQGMSCGLPATYSAELDRLWNTWLTNKYGSSAALANAWAVPAGGSDSFSSNLTVNASGPEGWDLRCFNGALAAVSSDPSAAFQGASSAHINTTSTPGSVWSVQLDHAGLSLQSGQLYDLTVTFKGTPGTIIQADLIEDRDPYTFYQIAGSFNAKQDWQTLTLSFHANVTNAGHVQLNLDAGAVTGDVWIAQVSLTPHASNGLLPGESLAGQSVKRQGTANLDTFSLARNRDLHRFYYETEQSFFDGMNAYLRNTLGVKSMLTGTAVFGLPLNADLASHQDFVDEHVYPEYPFLTDTPGALSTWTIPNVSFTRNPGFLLFTWASLAVAGKPFTVTESDEAFPNDYAVEWLPWLTTVANFQDWDALMPKMYGNWPDDYFAAMPPGWTGNNFFALGGNPLASAQFPVASRIFLASQNTPAAQQVGLHANRTDLLQSDPKLVTGQVFGAKGYADWQALVHSLRTDYGDAPSSSTPYPGGAPAVITSDHGELAFDQSNPNAPLYKVNSPNLQAVTGFLAGAVIDLPNLGIAISASTAPFGSITLQPVDGQPLLSSKRLLLSIVTRYEHTGQIWNSSRTSLGANWGTAPSLVEPISGSYSLRLRSDSEFVVYALDERGNRMRQVGDGVGNVQLSLDTGADQTVWYEVVAVRTAAPAIQDRFYYLVAESSGLCVDVQGGQAAIADGVPIQQWGCWGGDNQKWKLVPSGQGTYRIISKTSGKLLDVTGGPSALNNGVPIQQWSLWGGTNQLWQLVPVGDLVQLVAVSSGSCLDVTGGPAALQNGVRLQQWSCWGGSNQFWQLIPAN